MIKNVLFVFLALIISFSKANSQGLYFGINGSYLKNAMIIEDHNNDLINQDFTLERERLNSLNWGINVGYKLSEKWSFETGIQFVNVKTKEDLDLFYHYIDGPISTIAVIEIDWYSDYHYARIPLLAYYDFFSAQSKFGLSLFTGPDIGFLIGESSRFMDNDDASKQYDLDYTGFPVNKFDFGLQIGLKAKVKLFKSFSLYAESSIYRGIPNIINLPKEAYSSYYNSVNMFNGYYLMKLGIQYNLSN